MPYALQSLSGLLLIPLLVWAFCENREKLPFGAAVRVILGGLAVQLVIALALLKLPQTQIAFRLLNDGVHVLESSTSQGMQFVFGYLAGGPAPFDVAKPQNAYLLGFRALPLILTLSVLSQLLYHWNVMPRLVSGAAWIMRRSLGITGPLATAAGATVFFGMVEGPLVIRPYLPHMGRGGLFALMTVGMATVAGTVLALYASVLNASVPDAAGHVLTASIMSVPAALMLSRLLVPDGFGDDEQTTVRDGEVAGRESLSAMDAIAQGTGDGLRLLATVIAMLVVMLTLVAIANALLGAVLAPFGVAVTFQGLLGWFAAPLAWAMGIPWNEAATGGTLIGIKTVLNELIAYIELAKLPEGALSPRSRLILTYGLCGFANLGSLGIMMGGMTALVPSRRAEIAGLGLKAVITGGLATLMSGAMVGLVI